MSFIKPALRRISDGYFYFTARLISILLPTRLWYTVLLRICSFEAFLLQPVLALSPYRNDPRRPIVLAWLIHSSLRRLAALERPFQIPIRVQGAHIVDEARRNRHGMVICSVHLPLAHCLLRSLVEIGHRPTVTVAAITEQRNERVPLWGLSDGIPAVVPDHSVWFKVRSILRHGGSTFALIDRGPMDPIHTNIFRIVRLIGARVVFAIAELQPSGEILVEYFEPPDPFLTREESIAMNLEVLAIRKALVLHSSVQPPTVPLTPVFYEEGDVVGLTKLDSKS